MKHLEATLPLIADEAHLQEIADSDIHQSVRSVKNNRQMRTQPQVRSDPLGNGRIRTSLGARGVIDRSIRQRAMTGRAAPELRNSIKSSARESFGGGFCRANSARGPARRGIKRRRRCLAGRTSRERFTIGRVSAAGPPLGESPYPLRTRTSPLRPQDVPGNIITRIHVSLPRRLFSPLSVHDGSLTRDTKINEASFATAVT
ncbi:hypothetical protein EVAR_93919_1 [Eumeta japonica]|uniref:Uncharacterized protein n=1 Tax=Eumeta variegata TaxID=151549 RepID=A0A4C1TP34_EUMVA|nr:hypothetical protein EVAR_93919_1 [Eumeta japonica]